MGLEKMISAVAILAVLAASTGYLPQIIIKVQIAQLKLLKGSHSKSWGQALLLPGKLQK